MSLHLSEEDTAAIQKLKSGAFLTVDEVMDILAVINCQDKQMDRIIYAAFCAAQGGEEDIKTLCDRCEHWMNYERS